MENKLQSLWWRVLYIAREISSHLTLFLRRMGNARSRACGMNYPLHTHWVSSGKGQELCWCSVSCRKQLQQRADFSALCPFSLFFHRSPEAHFWCGKFFSLVMSSFSSLFFQFSSALLNEPSLMCDRADQLQIDYFTSGRTISCHLFALLLSSFHFSSHVFHFVIISSLKHIPSTPGEGLACPKVHLFLPMASSSQGNLASSFANLAGNKTHIDKTGSSATFTQKNSKLKADRRWEPRNQGNLPFTWERWIRSLFLKLLTTYCLSSSND